MVRRSRRVGRRTRPSGSGVTKKGLCGQHRQEGLGTGGRVVSEDESVPDKLPSLNGTSRASATIFPLHLYSHLFIQISYTVI